MAETTHYFQHRPPADIQKEVRIAGRKIGLSPCMGRECEGDKMRYV